MTSTDGTDADPMERSAAARRGEILAALRAFAGVSQGRLAEALGVDRTTAGRMEAGKRGKWLVDPEVIAGAAARLGLAQPHADALAGLWQAAATPTGLPPRSRWTNNYYRQPGKPCWAWLRTVSPDGEPETSPRTTPGTLTDLWWGAAFQHTSVVKSGPGVLIQFPTNLPNPAFEVTFAGRGGWVDFGEGVVPSEMARVLGIEVVDPRVMLSVQPPVDPAITVKESMFLRLLFSNLRDLAERLSITWSILFPHLGMARSERTPVPLDGLQPEVTAHAGEVSDRNGALLTQLTATREQVQRVREAAGLSQATAARLATALDPGQPVHEDQVRRLESLGRVATTPGFLSRLDMVYRADGRTGLEVVFDSSAVLEDHAGASGMLGVGQAADSGVGLDGGVGGVAVRATRLRRSVERTRHAWDIQFPHYWVGHVWVQAISMNPRRRYGDIDFVWGRWRRLQKTRSGCVFTTRKSEPGQGPLRVTVPLDWRIVVGVGASPSALDINRGWWPVNLLAAHALLTDALATVRDGTNNPLSEVPPPTLPPPQRFE